MASASQAHRGVRFAAALSDEELVDEVRLITLRIAPDDPAGVSCAAFDQARAHHDSRGVPSAAGIRKRLAPLTWRELLAFVHDPGRDVLKTVQMRNRRAPTAPPSRDECRAALRLIDGYCDPADPRYGRPEIYEEIRARLVARAARRYIHGANPQTLLPDRYEIENVYRQHGASGWDLARADAGLPPRAADHSRRAGNDHVEMAMRMGEELGVLPSSLAHLRAYAEAKLESLAMPRGSFTQVIAEANRRRRELGLDDLPRAPRGSREVGQVAACRDATTSPRRGAWQTREQIIAGLAEAFVIIGPTAKLSQVQQRRLARDHPGRIPHPSAVQKYVCDHPELGITAADLREQARNAARQEPTA